MKYYYVTSQRVENGERWYSADVYDCESFTFVVSELKRKREYMMACVEITEEEATELKNKGIK